MYSVNNTC